MDDEYKFKAYDYVQRKIEKDKIYVYSNLSKKSYFLTRLEIDLLNICMSFKSLEEHARYYCRMMSYTKLRRNKGFFKKILLSLIETDSEAELPINDKDLNLVVKKLQELKDKGLLISESELYDKLTYTEENKDFSKVIPDKISVMGIPTCGRPKILDRCLKSFINNFKKYDRRPDIIVLDDSRNQLDQKKNIEVLCEWDKQYNGNIFYMDRQRRNELSIAIAKKTGLDNNIVNFALMGHNSCERSEGGCRNTLLLLTNGKLLLQTDDDTICNIGSTPNQESGLDVSSDSISDEYWFFGTHSDATSFVEFSDKDFLGLHEEILGRSPIEVITNFSSTENGLDFDRMKPSFLLNMRNEGARIRMTSVGPVGDTCLNTDLYRLFLKGDSLNRLINPTEESFKEKLTTRQVIRGVTRNVVSDYPRCIGMNFAVDNRSLLPPFMPVQARCDGIFGDLMNLCFPVHFAGNVPYVIEHKPPKTRKRNIDGLFELAEQVRINDLVTKLIYDTKNWPYNKNPETNLDILGNYFSNIGSYKKDEFEQKIRNLYINKVGRSIQVNNEFLNNATGKKKYWYKYMREYLSRLQKSFDNTDYLVPVDVDKPTSQNKEDFQEVISLFGKMLSAWAEIYNVMQDFSDRERQRYLMPVNQLKP